VDASRGGNGVGGCSFCVKSEASGRHWVEIAF
jgi:hypothetical protein